jgi:hypothetical protein
MHFSPICMNTEGDYYCQCNSGYRSGSDNKTCTGKDLLQFIILMKVSYNYSLTLLCQGQRSQLFYI